MAMVASTCSSSSSSSLLLLPPPPAHKFFLFPSRIPSPIALPFPAHRCCSVFAIHRPTIWQEYQQAVQRKDLGTALQILESLDAAQNPSLPFVDEEDDPQSEQLPSLPFRLRRDEEELVISRIPVDLRNVLDACLSATDLKLVGRTYNLLQLRGLIPNFGRYKSISADGPREVTPSVLLKSAGLEASKLSPKKWGLSGNSVPVVVGSLALVSFLVNNGIEIRPLLLAMFALTMADAIYLGGTGFAQVLSLWPPYRKRVLVHEAGHLLVAYLLGCPVRGVILDAAQAMELGIQGQAGTQFWDATLEEELRQGLLTNASLDRYSMVLFAGIAAEALVYGEAEGGENDENLFKSIISLLRPPWSASQMSNQARWAVLQSFMILKEHRKVLELVMDSLGKGATLGTLVREIEDVIPSRTVTT